MKTIIKENNWLTRGISDFGWGNGYVVLPEGHKWHGMPYENIPVEVHYGLTFGEFVTDEFIEHWPKLTIEDKGCYVIGFDTCHCNDNLDKWPKEAVQAEADLLLEQCL